MSRSSAGRLSLAPLTPASVERRSDRPAGLLGDGPQLGQLVLDGLPVLRDPRVDGGPHRTTSSRTI
jgi:hypothetical protein